MGRSGETQRTEKEHRTDRDPRQEITTAGSQGNRNADRATTRNPAVTTETRQCTTKGKKVRREDTASIQQDDDHEQGDPEHLLDEAGQDGQGAEGGRAPGSHRQRRTAGVTGIERNGKKRRARGDRSQSARTESRAAERESTVNGGGSAGENPSRLTGEARTSSTTRSLIIGGDGARPGGRKQEATPDKRATPAKQITRSRPKAGE